MFVSDRGRIGMIVVVVVSSSSMNIFIFLNALYGLRSTLSSQLADCLKEKSTSCEFSRRKREFIEPHQG